MACSDDDNASEGQQVVVEGWIEDGEFPIVKLSSTIPITDNFSGIGCALDSDQVNVIMDDKDKDMSITANALRTANNVVLSYPASWAGDEVELYGYVTTSVTEPTFIPAYNGNVYPKMSSISTHIATLDV